jgi:hypothetical protein
MYGLPKDFDGSFLVGRILEMVCFSQNQVYLHLEGKVAITIESAISCGDDQIVYVPVKRSNLMEFLGASVSAVRGDDRGTLSLFFDNGQTLKIFDTTKQYESYTITHGDKNIII